MGRAIKKELLKDKRKMFRVMDTFIILIVVVVVSLMT